MKKKKYSKLARWWCELNAWKIPKALKTNWPGEKNQDFVRGAFSMLEIVMTDEDGKDAMDLWKKKYNSARKI
jgi:hypothetical protein